MKNVVLTLTALACLIVSPLRAAEVAGTPRAERFYGKITELDPNLRNITVHNSKQAMNAQFQWNDRTKIVSDKKPIAVTELKVGQSLMISYVTENNVNKAQRISVRRPFKKRAE